MNAFIEGTQRKFMNTRDHISSLEFRINSVGMNRHSFADYCGVGKGCVDKWISGTHKFNPIANRVLIMLENGYEE